MLFDHCRPVNIQLKEFIQKGDSLKSGQIQFYDKKADRYCEKVFIEETHDQGRRLTKYFLDLDKEMFYSENLKLK